MMTMVSGVSVQVSRFWVQVFRGSKVLASGCFSMLFESHLSRAGLRAGHETAATEGRPTAFCHQTFVL